MALMTTNWVLLSMTRPPLTRLALTGLRIRYPLKGGRGIEVSELEIGPFGPEDDRRWMVIDPDGSLVTQREVASLCQIGATPSVEGLTLTAPNRAPLTLPRPATGAPSRVVRVWADAVAGIDLGEEGPRWLTEALDRPVRMVYLPADADRRTDQNYDPSRTRVGYADGYPLLVVGTASLEDLNGRRPAPLPMNRFRPNVVVSGAAPYAEDTWRDFAIGGLPFAGVKPCLRCQVTTTDQATGARAQEPLRTLATYRKDAGGGVRFGMNVVHRDQGRIRIDDAVTVTRTA